MTMSTSAGGRPSLSVRSQQPGRQRPARRRARISTTPGHLRMLMLMLVIGTCMLWAVGEAATVTARAQVDRFGYHTAPAILDALRLHAYLADADRLAANDFLLGSQGENEKRQEFELDIAAADRELQQAAELDEPGSQAAKQLQQINALLIRYIGLVETARAYAHSPSPLSAAYLHEASALMHRPADGILARVDILATPNADDPAVNPVKLHPLIGMVVAFFAIALVLLSLLVYTQVFLRRRFRRRISPPILAAMFLLIALSGWMALHSLTTYRNLSVAEGVAFTKLHRLSVMKSLVADANADESLSLIGRGDAGARSQFQATTEQIVNPPLTDDMAEAGARGDIRFSGLLADEMHDATPSEDRTASVRVLRGYQEFLAVDASFRAKAMAGKRDDAIALVVGSTQFGTAFADLNIALQQRMEFEQARFDATVASARPGLDTDVGIGLAAAAIAMLILYSLRPRIAEYGGMKVHEEPEWRRGLPPGPWDSNPRPTA